MVAFTGEIADTKVVLHRDKKKKVSYSKMLLLSYSFRILTAKQCPPTAFITIWCLPAYLVKFRQKKKKKIGCSFSEYFIKSN